MLASPHVLRIADACATAEDAAVGAVQGKGAKYVGQAVDVCLKGIQEWETGQPQVRCDCSCCWVLCWAAYMCCIHVYAHRLCCRVHCAQVPTRLVHTCTSLSKRAPASLSVCAPG